MQRIDLLNSPVIGIAGDEIEVVGPISYARTIGKVQNLSRAMLGTNGTDTALFPDLYYPRGFDFSGSTKRITAPHSRLLSFTDEVLIKDLPFTVVSAIRLDTPTGNWCICAKGSSSGDLITHDFPEWRLVGTTTKLLAMYMYNDQKKSIGRYGTIPDKYFCCKQLAIVIATYNGAGYAISAGERDSGIKLYMNNTRIDSAELPNYPYDGRTGGKLIDPGPPEVWAYGMQLTDSAFVTGYDTGGYYMRNDQIVFGPYLYDWEFDSDDVAVMTEIIRDLYSIASIQTL